MLLIGYCIPQNRLWELKEFSSEKGMDLINLIDLVQLNHVDISKIKTVVAFGAGSGLRKKIRTKSGENTIFIWLSNTGDELDKKADISNNFYQNITDEPGDIKETLKELFRKNELRNRLLTNKRVINRLDLIHGLTQKALSITSEKDIRADVMKELFTFYDAITCTYLEYDKVGSLRIQSQTDKTGEIRHDINQKVDDPREYEECSSCGDITINCKSLKKGEPVYICAPLIMNDKQIGFLRIYFIYEEIDFTVDRIVLRIAADVLIAARERDNTTRALHESNKRASTILDTTVDAIITIDETGCIHTFNQAAINLFGYELDDVKGKSIQVLMPSPFKEEHDGYMKNYQQTGERQIIGIGREVTGRRKDGSMFPMYLAVSEYEVNGRQMFTGIVRDITEERQLEQEVMRISEHERHRIGQDLHDGLGQMLSGIGLLSRRVANKLESEKHALSDDMNEIRELIKEADDYSRGLARGLVKIDLDRGGFSAVIEKLVRQSERLFRINCELSATQDVDITERTRAEHVYRIVQEAINNAVKHGQSSEVKVSMTMGHNVLRISIKDNGTGFPKDWRSKEGLGVRIMEFRSRLIGAHFEQHNNADGGAIVTCSVPNP